MPPRNSLSVRESAADKLGTDKGSFQPHNNPREASMCGRHGESGGLFTADSRGQREKVCNFAVTLPRDMELSEQKTPWGANSISTSVLQLRGVNNYPWCQSMANL